MSSLGEAMESYYAQRAGSERMKQKSHSLKSLLSNHLQRCQKKLVIQRKTLKDSQKKEQYSNRQTW